MIIGDHAIVLDLLANAVGSLPGIHVIGSATDLAEAERFVTVHGVDLVIADYHSKTSDDLDFIRLFRARQPGIKCIVIVASKVDFRCAPDVHDSVVAVIDKAESGEKLLREVARAVHIQATVPVNTSLAHDVRHKLTSREWELFVALGDGLSNKELGSLFGISTRTVETHRKSIAGKLGVSGAALVRLAVLQRREVSHSPQPRHPASVLDPPANLDDG